MIASNFNFFFCKVEQTAQFRGFSSAPWKRIGRWISVHFEFYSTWMARIHMRFVQKLDSMRVLCSCLDDLSSNKCLNLLLIQCFLRKYKLVLCCARRTVLEVGCKLNWCCGFGSRFLNFVQLKFEFRTAKKSNWTVTHRFSYVLKTSVVL